MRRLLPVILICSLIVPLITSCYDATEIDNMAYVITIGIDKGKIDKVRVTLQFATMKGQSGGGGSGGGLGAGGGGGGGGGSAGGQEKGGVEVEEQEGYTYVSIEAPTFETAMNSQGSIIPRRLNLMHARFLVFSEEFAKGGNIGEVIGSIRFRQLRRTTRVMVTKGEAVEFIRKNQPLIGTSLSKTLENITRENVDTGFFPDVNLHEFYNDLKSPYGQPITMLAAVVQKSKLDQEGGGRQGGGGQGEGKTGAQYYAGQLPRKGGNPIEIVGCALFEGEKMVGQLNGEDTTVALMARNEFRRGFFTLPDPEAPGKAVPLDVRAARPRQVSVHLEGEQPVIHLTIQLEGDLMSVASMLNYENEELKPVLEKSFEQHITRVLNRVINKTQELNGDIYNFGQVAAMQFATIHDFEQYQWNQRFRDAEVIPKVEFTIRRTGMLLKSSPIPKSKILNQ